MRRRSNLDETPPATAPPTSAEVEVGDPTDPPSAQVSPAQRFRFELCGLPVTLTVTREVDQGPSPRADLPALLAPFTTDRPPLWRLAWNRRGVATPGRSTVQTTLDGGELAVDAPGFSARLDLRRRRGELRGAPPGGIVTCLLGVLAHEAIDLLPLHASAVTLEEGGAHGFCGPGGMGKTTLARSLGHGLADDVIVLRRRPSGWVVHGTPFWEGRPATERLDGLHLLVHGPLARRPLSPRAALRRLLPAVRLVLPEAGPQRALALLARPVEEVTVDELCFSLADLPDGVRQLCTGAAR